MSVNAATPDAPPRKWTKVRSEIANAARAGHDSTDLQRELKEARLAQHIADVVASAPPLTPEQRSRLAALLRAAS